MSIDKHRKKNAFEQRELLNRTVSYLKKTHLGNVRSWLNRINIAIETEANRVKNGRTDIRRWLEKHKDQDSGMCELTVHSNNYVSDTMETLNFTSNLITKNPAPN